MTNHDLEKIFSRFAQLEQLIADINIPAFVPVNVDTTKKNELYTALAKAKLEYRPVRFNRSNEFSKQVYADLQVIQESTNIALGTNGLSLNQYPFDKDGITYLKSTLSHSSGQELDCVNKLILPPMTGAKTDLNRFGEALAYLKRQVAQSMLGIVACNDPEDNDDGYQANQEYQGAMLKAVAGDPTPSKVDQGIFTDKITREQLDDLYYELQNYPLVTETLKRGLEINELADLPKAKFKKTMQDIREKKLALRDVPQKQW